MKQTTVRAMAAGLSLAGAASVAMAHPGHGSGFVAGMSHPFSGLDHVLAMVAVGILAAQRGGKAVWALPVVFMGMMAVGGLVAGGGAEVPMVEQGIAASVLVLGLLVAGVRRLPLRVVVGLVGFFAMFHGYAHVAEMGAGSAGAYGAGFVLATGLLHLAGVGLGMMMARRGTGAMMRWGGAAMVGCGVAMVLGVL